MSCPTELVSFAFYFGVFAAVVIGFVTGALWAQERL